MYGKKGHNLESEIQAESWTYKCLEIDVDKHLSEQERISQSHPGDILCSVSQKLLLFLSDKCFKSYSKEEYCTFIT